MKKQFKARKKGYTLTEILVVVLIISVLSAVVYPLYTKAITKSRAVEAINLLEMVRNKQIQKYARDNQYYSDFQTMGQLTSNLENEVISSGGAQLKIKDYTLSLNNATKCMNAKYQKGSALFTFSTSYENAGLGCTGAICTSFGDIIGDAKTVCNCGGKTCTQGFDLNEDTCVCDCNMECNQNGACFAVYGGGLTRPCSSGCGTETSAASCGGSVWSGKCWSVTQTQGTSQACAEGCGTMTRSCTATCEGGSCGEWNKTQCKAPSQDQSTTEPCPEGCGTMSRTCSSTCDGGSCGTWNTSQCKAPAQSKEVTQSCGGGLGTQTRTCNATCDGGECGEWSVCQCESGYHLDGSTCVPDKIDCKEEEKPAASEDCGNGTKYREITCDTSTGKWQTGEFGVCECASGYHLDGSTCVPDKIDCKEEEKPAASEDCGNGTKYREITCDTSTGKWQTGEFGVCECSSGYHLDGSTCVPDKIDCKEEEKPAEQEECGWGSGYQYREVTCDTSTGKWQAGEFGICQCEYEACWDGANCLEEDGFYRRPDGTCAACTNKPDNSFFGGYGGASDSCDWYCNTGFNKQNGTCVARNCSAGYTEGQDGKCCKDSDNPSGKSYPINGPSGVAYSTGIMKVIGKATMGQSMCSGGRWYAKVTSFTCNAPFAKTSNGCEIYPYWTCWNREIVVNPPVAADRTPNDLGICNSEGTGVHALMGQYGASMSYGKCSSGLECVVKIAPRLYNLCECDTSLDGVGAKVSTTDYYNSTNWASFSL